MRNDEALTAEDVAEILQVSRSSVYKLVKTDELASYYVGRKLRFTMADVENYIARSRKAKAREAESARAGTAAGAPGRGSSALRTGSVAAGTTARPSTTVDTAQDEPGSAFVLAGNDIVGYDASHMGEVVYEN